MEDANEMLEKMDIFVSEKQIISACKGTEARENMLVTRH
jgi:hypothetical protein